MSDQISTTTHQFIDIHSRAKVRIRSITDTGDSKTAIAAPSLKSDLNGKKPISIPKQSTLNLPTIYFAANSAEVPSDSKADLEQAAIRMKQLPAATGVRISGFADSTGSPTGNMKLSQERANAVRQVLVDAGVNRLRHLPFCSQWKRDNGRPQ
jgi:outer membrane protein OmpA-like peptidoglycan-associated protein